MEEKRKSEAIYKSIMLIIITILITAIVTTIVVYNVIVNSAIPSSFVVSLYVISLYSIAIVLFGTINPVICFTCTLKLYLISTFKAFSLFVSAFNTSLALSETGKILLPLSVYTKKRICQPLSSKFLAVK